MGLDENFWSVGGVLDFAVCLRLMRWREEFGVIVRSSVVKVGGSRGRSTA